MRSNFTRKLSGIFFSSFKMLRGFILSALVLAFINGNAQTTTFPSGSFIINMGVNAQSKPAGLKPYGMIYDLIKNYNVPVNWYINPSKAKDGIDFTYNGVAYRGGAFIIDAMFITTPVATAISQWTANTVVNGKGLVVGAYTTSPLTLSTTYRFTAVPTWTLDAQNGSLAVPYFTNAGIPTTAYNWLAPANLGACNDIFVMPHADPTWAVHGNLYTWNDIYNGSIWLGCHAGSALANTYNPNNISQQMNFLVSKRPNTGIAGDPIAGSTAYAQNSLLLWGNHGNGSTPYNTNTGTVPNGTLAGPSDPVSQFIGTPDLAMLNGSEQIYLPIKGQGWLPSTNIITYDPTQADIPIKSDGTAALIAYGRAFGDPGRGLVMYEAGHSLNKGTTGDVAAQKAFFNWSFLAMLDKIPVITSVTGIPVSGMIQSGSTLNLAVNYNNVAGPYTATWSCVKVSDGTSFGSFNPNGTTAAINTVYTAPSGITNNVPCIISVTIKDACGRQAFESFPVTITPVPLPPVVNNEATTLDPGCGGASITYNVLTNDTDPLGLPLSLNSVNGSTSGSYTVANGSGTFTSNGNITFTPTTGFIGVQQIPYSVCNSASLCSPGIFSVTVGDPNKTPTVVNDAVTIAEDNIITIPVLTNDVQPGSYTGGALSLRSVTSPPAHGRVSVNPDNTITYIPNADYAGSDAFTYQVINTSGYMATAIVNVTVNNDACDGNTYQSSAGKSGTITFTPSSDSYLREDQTSRNYGSCAVISIDRETNKNLRGLLHFNLLGTAQSSTGDAFPTSGATINSAILRMYLTAQQSNNAFNIAAHKITSSWDEGTLCDNAGVSNWNVRTGTTNWTSPGGDYSLTLEYTTSVTNTTGGIGGTNRYEWNIPLMTQDWYTSASTNYGVLLKFATEDNGGNEVKTFGSRTAASSANYPQLVISWSAQASCTDIPNRSPLANPDYGFTTNSVTPLVVSTIKNNDTDDGTINVTAASIISGPGSISNINGNGFTYTPASGIIGPVIISYTISDGTTTDQSTVTIDVTNTPIQAVNDNPAGVNSGLAQSINVMANDIDPENQKGILSIITQPANGTALVNNNNTPSNYSDDYITYTPVTGFTGTDPFIYKVCENLPVGPCPVVPNCSSATVTPTVLNQPPTATNDIVNMLVCNAFNFDVISNDTDPENGLLSVTNVSALSNPASGTLVNNNNGTLTFTPAVGFQGTVTFTYTVTDNGVPPATSSPATVTINVSAPVNHAPVAVDDYADPTLVNQPVYDPPVLDNDYDPDGNPLTNPVIIVNPLHGIATVLPNGLIYYQPNPGYYGTDQLTYQICDLINNPSTCSISTGLCATAVMHYDIINSYPLAVNDASTTNLNTPVTINVLANDNFGIDGPSVGSITATNGAHGIATVNNNSTPNDPTDDYIVYTPNTNFSGIDQFTYTIYDSNGDPSTATVTVTINSVQADLQISKTDNRDTYTPGTTTTYIIVASNAGSANVIDAIVADNIPVGTTATWTATGTSGTLFTTSGTNSINDVVTIPAGGSITYTVILNIPSGYTCLSALTKIDNKKVNFLRNGPNYKEYILNGACDLVNTATITAPPGITDPTPGNNSSTDTDAQNIVADLAITKDDGSATYIPGTSTTYTIIVSNNGPSDVIGSTVQDLLPAGTTGSWSATGSAGTVYTANGTGNINDVVTMPAGSSITYTLALTIPAGVSGNLVNSGTVSVPAGVTDTNNDNNSATDTDAEASLPSWTLAKAATEVSYASVGSVLHYTLTLTNTGNVSISSISVLDPTADATPVYVSGDVNSNTILEPGEVWIYSATHTVTQADLNAGSYHNTATASGTPAGGTLDPATGSATVPASQQPMWTLAKAATEVSYASVGSVLHYTLTLTNTGNVSISSISVLDPTADATPVYVSGDVNSNTILEPGEVWIYSATHTVTQADLNAGSYHNTATASGTPAGGTLDPATGSATVPASQQPMWTLAKAATEVSYASVGSVLHYTLTLTNTGNVSISSISVLDPTADATPVYVSGDVNSNTILEPGEVWIYSATHTVTQADLNAGSYHNTATASGTPAGGTLDPATGSATVPASQQPMWTLAKAATEVSYASVGSVLHYTLTLTNTGNVSISSISVLDPTADATPVYVSGDVNSNTILEPGEVWIYSATHTVTQADLNAGSYHNTATASGTPAGGTLDPATGSATVPASQQPMWTLAKAATEVSYASVGSVLHYTLTLTNTGNVSISSISVLDPTADATPVYVSGDVNSNTILEPGEVWIYSATHTVTQADLNAGSYHNTATASGTPAGGTLDPATGSATVPASQQPMWTLAKAATEVSYASVGSVLHYTLTLTNTGNVSISSISVLDPTADATPVYVSGDVNSNTILEPGEVWIYSATHTVTQADLNAGSYHNTATASGTPAGGTLDPATGSATVPASQQPMWTLAKAATEVSYASVGSVLHYTLTLTNTGNVSISSISVLDPTADATPVYVSGDVNSNTILEPGEVWIYSATHTVTQADLNAGSYHNTATASGTPQQGTLNDATASATVKALAIACPANISDYTTSETCASSTTIPAPVIYGSYVTVTWSMTGATTAQSPATGINILSAYTFNKGITTVTYTVVNADGQTVTCSFMVTITDNVKPVIVCPPYKQLPCNSSIDPSITGTATATDNCGTTTITYTDVTEPNISNGIITGYTTTRTWKAKDGSGNYSTCTQLITTTGCNGTFPTNTTCTDFSTGTINSFTQLCYKPLGRKIGIVTPGVFFYYARITAPSTSFCIDILQSNDKRLPLFQIQKDQMILYNSSCTKVAGGVEVTRGNGRVCITNATIGAVYILSVKYDAKSLEGASFTGSAPTALYSFISKIGNQVVPNSSGSIYLAPNCKVTYNKTAEVLANSVSLEIEPVTTITAYPNPYGSVINFSIVPAENGRGLLELYDLLGRRLAILYDGNMVEKQRFTVKYDVYYKTKGVLIYKLTTQKGILHGKLIPGDVDIPN